MPDERALPAALIAATAVGLVLRLAFLGTTSLNYEEIFTHTIATQSSISGVWHTIKADESTPPLFYVLTWGWLKLFGVGGAASLRAISLIAGTLTVPVAFFAVRSFVGDRVAVAVSALCAVSPLLITYSIYARSYALLVLVGALSVWAMSAVLADPSRRHFAIWALAVVACLWTHYFAGFLVVGEALVLAWRLRDQLRELAAACAAALILAAPLWPLFSSQSGASGRTQYITSTPLRTRLVDGVRQFTMGNNVPAAWFEAIGIVLALGGVAYVLARRDGRRSLAVPVIVALIATAPPILLAATGIEDKLLARNLLGAWVCLAPVAAYGLTRLRAVPLAAYLAVCLVAVLVTQTNWRYRGSSAWAGASARLGQRADGAPVAVIPGIDVIVGAYYLHRRQLSAAVASRQLWVIVEPARGASQRGLAPVADPPIARLFGAQWHAVGELDYDGFRMIDLRSAATGIVPPAPGFTGAGSPPALVLAP